MKKTIICIIILIIISLLTFFPKIEFYHNNYLYLMSYSKNWEDSEDLEEIEQEFCYDESYSYNKKRDISIINWEYKNILFFKWFKITYEKGNICETEFLLEESYIKDFIDNAIIIENDNNVDLKELIKGKTAIVDNKRYPWNDEHNYISYKLNGKYNDMFISTNEEDLLIIQVGSSDEGAKYIAYK